jgi:hypothetical protein
VEKTLEVTRSDRTKIMVYRTRNRGPDFMMIIKRGKNKRGKEIPSKKIKG